VRLIYISAPAAHYPHVFRFEGLSKSYDECVNPIVDWCTASFGLYADRYYGHGRWLKEWSALYFKHEEDAFAVRMRWC
jgi:hypothetical protein